jgi:hypothetical protein
MTIQIMAWAVINGPIALATVGVQYAALWLADLASRSISGSGSSRSSR